MVRDNITRTGARAPGVRDECRLMAVLHRAGDSDSVRRVHAAAESTKDGGKPDLVTGTLGASLTEARPGKALSDRPALEPYWGKPTVRNLRGDDGNVGIIRSPVRAIVLPDNRHEAKNAKLLRERTSDPLGPESCASPIARWVFELRYIQEKKGS